MFLPWFQIFLEIWSMEELISLYTNQWKRLPPSAYPNTPHHRPPPNPRPQGVWYDFHSALYICYVYMFRLKFLQSICLE